MELTQWILLGIIAASIEEKPILVSSHTRNDRIIHIIQEAVSTLFDRPRPTVVKCEKWTTWHSLENDIRHASQVSEFVLVAAPAALDTATQAHLTEIVESKQFRMIFIGTNKGLSRILCKHIFFQLQLPAENDPPVSSREHVGINNQLADLRIKAKAVHISNQIRQYSHDIVVFTRTHRFVAKGVPPVALQDILSLVRILAVFAGLDYVAPQLVAVAARLVIPPKIELCDPGNDISLEYGGDLDIISEWIKNWDTVLLVDNVIEHVPAPL